MVGFVPVVTRNWVTKLAVYVVAADGAEMVWLELEAPFDHDDQDSCTPVETACGEGAASVWLDPGTQLNVCEPVYDVPSTVTWAVAGEAATVTGTRTVCVKASEVEFARLLVLV
jgi:hypothetical protein